VSNIEINDELWMISHKVTLLLPCSEWKWLYVQATQKCYIWTRKAQKKEKLI